MDRMRKSYLRMGLFLFLAGLTVSSAILYFSSLKEKYDLSVSVSRLKLQLNNLEQERQGLVKELEAKKELEARLIQENTQFKENIESIQEQVAVLNSAFQTARAKVKSLSSKILVLQEENKALSSEKKALSDQMIQVSQERDAMKSKFESVAELKQAIKDLKRRMYEARLEIRRRISPPPETILAERQPRQEFASEGNQGFIIKDGKLTIPSYRVKIEVKPNL